MAHVGNTLKYSGHEHFRHRLVLSVLSGKPVKIERIRPDDKNPGLRGAAFLGLGFLAEPVSYAHVR